ncbi:DUF4192 family protein [Dactylosporangium sp. NPDC006015]|uniref:DUF4192 family protein n=1 Tax=Dactylosporangium sp. NPDC006015 TaxID=3154576 RepID=UPI0033A4214B
MDTSCLHHLPQARGTHTNTATTVTARSTPCAAHGKPVVVALRRDCRGVPSPACSPSERHPGAARRTVAYLDLPDDTDPPGTTPTVTATTGFLHAIAAECTARDSVDLVVVGYGPARLAATLFDVATAVFTVHGLPVMHLVRVTGGRYVEHDVHRPEVPLGDPVPFTRTAPDRPARPAVVGADLAAAVAPVTGAAAAAMLTAFEQVRARLDTTAAQSGSPDRAMLRLGRAAVDAAVRRCEQGGTLDDLAAAELIALLRSDEVRDFVYLRTDGSDVWHLRLWLDLTRRAIPGYVAGPACLAGYVAWRTHRPELARLAVHRALSDDPGHALAAILLQLLDESVPPELAELLLAHHRPDSGMEPPMQ